MSRVGLGARVLRAGYERMLRPVLFRYAGGDPERIHDALIGSLAAVPATRHARECDPVDVAGIRFPNRVGLAAGLDKDGRAAAAWARFGFGFAELGTVTGQAQPGNPSPRLFRLKESRAIINRMGFNNRGAAAMAARLEALGVRRGNGAVGIPLGISIGKTKSVPLAASTADYLTSVQALHRYADYFAVNVSSPNTPGLRTLQAAQELSALLEALVTEAARLDARPVPVFVKLAPDLDHRQRSETIAVVSSSGAAGIIATNTTLSRGGIVGPDLRRTGEAGGLSGAPLTSRALRFVEATARATSLPVIGVGGIMAPVDAARMFDAGATLVQLYTGFIYSGPGLVRGINDLRRG